MDKMLLNVHIKYLKYINNNSNLIKNNIFINVSNGTNITIRRIFEKNKI